MLDPENIEETLPDVKDGMPSLHTVRRVQPDGSVQEYVYAWRGGPRITATDDDQIDAARRDMVSRFYRPKKAPKRGRKSLSDAEVISKVYHNARQRAKLKKTNFTIDLSVVRGLLEKQSWKCAISGIPFDTSFDPDRSFTYNPYGVSLDRIDCAEGYTRKNVRLVLTALNFAMNEWGEDIYLHIAKNVVARHLTGASSPSANVHGGCDGK